MNLYKHTFEHWSQKDSESGIRGFFLAENNREAYGKVYGTNSYDDCLAVDRFVGGELNDEDYETKEEICYIDGEKYPLPMTDEEVRQIVVYKGGELNFNDLDSLNCWSDLYYGRRLDGWELVKEDLSNEDITFLRSLNIIKGE